MLARAVKKRLTAVQTTLRTPVTVAGVGLHSGRPAKLTLRPSAAGTGIVFRRTDVADRDPMVPANWDRVAQSPLNTRIVNDAGTSVSTIEHLMAALAGTGLHNALAETFKHRPNVIDVLILAADHD